MEKSSDKTTSGKDRIEWSMSIDLSITYYNDVIDEYTKGRLYQDEQFGYYDRTNYCCSDSYSRTYRFNKNKMKDIILYIVEYSPVELEDYILSIEGCEVI